MAVYVDELVDYGSMVPERLARTLGTRWSHMTADTPDELHAMARKIGLKRSWCSDVTQPHSRVLHYDLVPSKRARALEMGAVFQTALERMEKRDAAAKRADGGGPGERGSTG